MSQGRYEVVYIDKFDNLLAAELFREQIRKRFKLNPTQLARLSCGLPVVVKKQVDLEEAKRYQSAFKRAGGVCWIQALGPDGKHYERRQGVRRQLLDRRTAFRASSVFPDRRQSCGRRSSDRSYR